MLIRSLKPYFKKDFSAKTLIISGIIAESFYILYMLIDTNRANTVLKYMIIGVLSFFPVFFIIFKTKKILLSKQYVPLIILFSLIFQLTLLAGKPEMSDDIYRYIWDGKVQNHGISPYRFAPDDKNLLELHSDIIPAMINYPHIKTIYPPVTQFIFSFSYYLFRESITGLKFLFVLFNLGSCLVLFFILLHLRKNLFLLILFAWNPLVIMETSINGHLEIVMVFFLLSAILFYLKEKVVLSGSFFAFSFLSKLIPIIFLPVIFIDLIKKEGRTKKLFSFFPPFILVSLFLSFVYIDTIFNMFRTALNYSSKWYFNNPVFYLIHAVFKNNQLSHLVSFSALIFISGFIYVSRYEINKKIFCIAVCFTLFNPTIHPWYLILLLGLNAIHYSGSVAIWSLTVISSYIVVYNYKISGEWHDSIFQMLIQYLPLIFFLLYSLKKRVPAGSENG